MASVVLARRGAIVNGVDISAGYVAETRKRATVNGVTVDAHVADAECLPFKDDSFDAVWGSSILHHLHLPTAARELRRVLKPEGLAVFCEPWGGNPLLRLARRWLPYPGKHRTPDEKPLTAADVQTLRSYFPNCEFEGYQCFGMLQRLHPRLRLDSLDRGLPQSVLQKLGRYLVLTMTND